MAVNTEMLHGKHAVSCCAYTLGLHRSSCLTDGLLGAMLRVGCAAGHARKSAGADDQGGQ